MAQKVKFHITRAGQIGMCNANVKVCPLGGEHYDTREEAAKVLMAAEVGPRTQPEPPAFTPLSKEQAERYISSLNPNTLTDEKLAAWLTTDNSGQLATLNQARELLDSDEAAAAQLLRDAGLLVPVTRYSDHEGYDVPNGEVVLHAKQHGWQNYDSDRLGPDSLRRCALHLRRTDRTTLLTAMGMTPADVPAPTTARWNASIASSVVEEIFQAKQDAERAKEEARANAPIDWKRVSMKKLRDELGHTYDPANARHVEFAAALEEAGLSKDRYFAPAGYRRPDKWKNQLLRQVKARHTAPSGAKPASSSSATDSSTPGQQSPGHEATSTTNTTPDRDPRHPYGRRKNKEEDKPTRGPSSPKELDPQMIEALKLKYLKKFKVPFDESGLTINELLQMAQQGELG